MKLSRRKEKPKVHLSLKQYLWLEVDKPLESNYLAFLFLKLPIFSEI